MVGGSLFKKQDQITMLGAEEGMTEGGIMVAEETTKEEVADIEVGTEDMDAVVNMEEDAGGGIAMMRETDTEVQRLIFILPLLKHNIYAELQRKGIFLL